MEAGPSAEVATTGGPEEVPDLSGITNTFLYNKLRATPPKLGSGSLGESCCTCSPWLGGLRPGVVLIRHNASTVPERNGSK